MKAGSLLRLLLLQKCRLCLLWSHPTVKAFEAETMVRSRGHLQFIKVGDSHKIVVDL